MTPPPTQAEKLCMIGIVTYKREELLRKSIKSAQHALPDNSDIYVVDNSPSEESRKIAADNPDVHWIFSNENRGCIPSRQDLMAIPGYRYYVSLDDDAWFIHGDEIAAAIALLEREAAVAAVAFDILTPDAPNRADRGAAFQVASFIGCGHVLRMADSQAVGGYAPSAGQYGSEEKDLCLRLLDSGKSVTLLRGYHVWHDKTDLGRDLPTQYASEVCNDLSFAVRRMPLLLLGPVLLRKCFMHLIYALRMKRIAALSNGINMFLRNLSSTIRNRRAVSIQSILRLYKLARS